MIYSFRIPVSMLSEKEECCKQRMGRAVGWPKLSAGDQSFNLDKRENGKGVRRKVQSSSCANKPRKVTTLCEHGVRS